MVGAQVGDDEDLFGAGFLEPPDDGHDDWEIPAGADLKGDAAAASAEPLEIPMAVIPPSAAPRVAPRAAPRTAAVAMGMPCGVIRFYPKTGTHVAQATAFAPEPAVLTRTLAASRVAARAGQGRPVGLLMAWLLHVDVAMGRDAHVHHGPSAHNFERRSEARLAFEAMDDPARDAILGAERGRRPGERSESFDIPCFPSRRCFTVCSPPASWSRAAGRCAPVSPCFTVCSPPVLLVACGRAMCASQPLVACGRAMVARQGFFSEGQATFSVVTWRAR